MMEMISLKCPECGANINIEADHKHCFCPYCGVQIIIDDGVTAYTYRKVDEAKIKEAEVDKIIRLKELELKEKQIKIVVPDTGMPDDGNLQNYIIFFFIGGCPVWHDG